MKRLILIVLLAVSVHSQTEFYLSTVSLFGNCEVVRNEQPYQCTITDRIKIYYVVWNPDSTDWCTTKEGFYRSVGYFNPPEWTLDGDVLDAMTSNEFTTRIFDTLVHTLTATTQGFPKQTFTYKAVNNRYNHVVCSKNVSIFESDSIKMTILTMDTALFIEEEYSPLIANVMPIDSNAALVTFNSIGDTAIKVDSICYNPFNKLNAIDVLPFVPVESYNPKLNSYTIWVPMLEQFELTLTKKRNTTATGNMIIDTIGIIFKKGSEFDTLKLRFQRIPNPPHTAVIAPNRQNAQTLQSTKSFLKVYDLKGRLLKSSKLNSPVNDFKPSSNGVYIKQVKGVGQELIEKEYLFR